MRANYKKGKSFNASNVTRWDDYETIYHARRKKKKEKIIIIMLKGRRTLLVIKCKGNMYHLDSWRKTEKGRFFLPPDFWSPPHARRQKLLLRDFLQILLFLCPRTNALFRISVNHILL